MRERITDLRDDDCSERGSLISERMTDLRERMTDLREDH